MSDSHNAHVVLHKLARALPQKHHSNIIIVGRTQFFCPMTSRLAIAGPRMVAMWRMRLDGTHAPDSIRCILPFEVAMSVQGWLPSLVFEATMTAATITSHWAALRAIGRFRTRSGHSTALIRKMVVAAQDSPATGRYRTHELVLLAKNQSASAAMPPSGCG